MGYQKPKTQRMNVASYGVLDPETHNKLDSVHAALDEVVVAVDHIRLDFGDLGKVGHPIFFY
jgi:hypothetical protein